MSLSYKLTRIYIKIFSSFPANIHRLGKGVIAEFLARGPDSFFQKCLTTRTNANPAIDFRVMLNLTAYDREIERQCQEFKNDGRIDSYLRDMTSGKISVSKNGKKRSINSEEDLLIYWLEDGDVSNFSTDSDDSRTTNF